MELRGQEKMVPPTETGSVTDKEPEWVAVGQAQWCSIKERGGQRSSCPQEGTGRSQVSEALAGMPQVRSKRKNRRWLERQEETKRRAAVAREPRGEFKLKNQLLL